MGGMFSFVTFVTVKLVLKLNFKLNC